MTRILVVDDNALFRREATRLCSAEGYETLTASTWSELNTTLAGTTPDIVLMDVDLPTIPGNRLASFVRVQHRIPIVLVSAFPEEKLRKLFDSSDADAWICKPLTRDKLVAAVTRFVPVEARSGGPESSAVEPAKRTGGRRRVLLVEDDAVIAERIAHVLAPSSEVVMVSDGEGAIERLWSDSFEVILLDLMLPRLSGFDVIRHLMMHRPDLLKATVVLSAATDQSLQFIDESAVHSVVRKPFDVLDLARLVAKM